MQLPYDVIDRLLDSWPVARLATTGARGAPQLVPVVFARSGGELWSPIDGKPKTGRELGRVANVRRHADVCLLLDHYEADWGRLWWLRIDARARVVRPVGVGGSAEPSALEALEALRGKYPQYEAVPVLREPATLLALRPTGRRSWCSGPEALRMLSA